MKEHNGTGQHETSEHGDSQHQPLAEASTLEPRAATSQPTGAVVALETVAASEAEPVDTRPAAVYLARLAPSGRRTMTTALHTIARLASAGRVAYGLPWHELRYEHTQAVRAVLAEVYAPATANKHLAALRGTLKAAWRLGLMDAESMQRACDLEPVRGTTLPAGRALSLGEIRGLFAACAGFRPADVRDSALIGVLYGCGLRRDEAVMLDLADHLPDDRQLRVQGKGSKERVAHLPPGADQALEVWVTLRGQQPGPLFVPIDKAGTLTVRRLTGQAVRLMLQRRARKAGVAAFSPHDLRRSNISQLLDSGADLNVVRGLAGRSTPAITARYDRRGERARQQAAQLLHIPYQAEAPCGA